MDFKVHSISTTSVSMSCFLIILSQRSCWTKKYLYRVLITCAGQDI